MTLVHRRAQLSRVFNLVLVVFSSENLKVSLFVDVIHTTFPLYIQYLLVHFFFVSLCYFFQIQQYSRNMDELKSQLGLSQDKLHKQAQDATRRDEQLVVLKVELATLQEKHRLIQEEVFVKCLICLFFSCCISQSH